MGDRKGAHGRRLKELEDFGKETRNKRQQLAEWEAEVKRQEEQLRCMQRESKEYYRRFKHDQNEEVRKKATDEINVAHGLMKVSNAQIQDAVSSGSAICDFSNNSQKEDPIEESYMQFDYEKESELIDVIQKTRKTGHVLSDAVTDLKPLIYRLVEGKRENKKVISSMEAKIIHLSKLLDDLKNTASSIKRIHYYCEDNNIPKFQEIVSEILRKVPPLRSSLHNFEKFIYDDYFHITQEHWEHFSEDSDTLIKLVDSLPIFTEKNKWIGANDEISLSGQPTSSVPLIPTIEELMRIASIDPFHKLYSEKFEPGTIIGFTKKRDTQLDGNRISMIREVHAKFFEGVINIGKIQFHVMKLSKKENELNNEYGYILLHFIKVERAVLDYQIKEGCENLKIYCDKFAKKERREILLLNTNQKNNRRISLQKSWLQDIFLEIRKIFKEINYAMDQSCAYSNSDLIKNLTLLAFLNFSWQNVTRELLLSGIVEFKLDHHFDDLQELRIVGWVLELLVRLKECGELSKHASDCLRSDVQRFQSLFDELKLPETLYSS